jgi:hypothetical protein
MTGDCPECQGMGTIECGQCGGDDESCTECLSGDIDCPICGGSGEVEMSAAEPPAPRPVA